MPLKGLRQSDKIRLVLDRNFDCADREVAGKNGSGKERKKQFRNLLQ